MREPVVSPWMRVVAVLDAVFFLLGAVAAGWLAVLTVRGLLTGGVRDWWLVLVLWVVLAYLLLPRLHTALALVYVPDYFIGRTRTYEGLLGDPVNVALLGSASQIHRAMEQGGWRLADELGFRSSLRTVVSTLARRTYPSAPVSPLFLFGRMQDFTYQQEVEGSPARRHHVRFWRVPDDWYLPGGARVDWVAAGTYDRRVGLSVFTLQVTHKIARDVDAERDHIVRTLRGGTPGLEHRVIEHFSSGFHSRNGGGDAIDTDGDLPVLDLRLIADDGWEPPTGSVRLRLASGPRAVIDTVRDSAASNRIGRPMALYVGYGLVLVRALVAIGTGVAVFLHLVTVPRALPLPAVLAPTLALVLTIVAALVYVLLGQLAFAGRSFPRMVALALSVVGIAVALSLWPAAGADWAFRLQLTNLVLDVGILVTLSASDVRDFDLRTPGAPEPRTA